MRSVSSLAFDCVSRSDTRRESTEACAAFAARDRSPALPPRRPLCFESTTWSVGCLMVGCSAHAARVRGFSSADPPSVCQHWQVVLARRRPSIERLWRCRCRPRARERNLRRAGNSELHLPPWRRRSRFCENSSPSAPHGFRSAVSRALTLSGGEFARSCSLPSARPGRPRFRVRRSDHRDPDSLAITFRSLRMSRTPRSWGSRECHGENSGVFALATSAGVIGFFCVGVPGVGSTP